MSKYVIEYKSRKSVVKFDTDLPFEMIHDLATLGPIRVWEDGILIFEKSEQKKKKYVTPTDSQKTTT